MSLYESYKPLRNRCRELKLDDSLYVLWAYSQYLQIRDFEMPNDIEVIGEFTRADFPQKFISEWALESLVREVILHAGRIAERNRSLKKWDHFAQIANLLRELESEISGKFVNQDNILIELNRIGNRQFVWQNNPPNSQSMMRYFRIFSEPELDRLIFEKTGLSMKDIAHIGMGFMGVYMKQPAVKYPIEVQFGRMTSEKVHSFLNFTCQSLNKIKISIRNTHTVDDGYAYSYNSLREYPLVRMIYRGDEVIFCPLPTLLFWRITGGLYYEICGMPNFSGPFGRSFEAYVCDVLRATIQKENFSILGEQQYGSRKNRKHTVDWILTDAEEAALFIECKTKRLSWRSRVALTNMTAVETDLEYLANAVTQLYKTISDYKKGYYPNLTYLKERRIYPLVVTLENWHLCGPATNPKLNEIIEKKFDEIELERRILEESPYSICSVDELEVLLQHIDKVGIHAYMDPKVFDREKRDWAFAAHSTNFARENGLVTKRLFDRAYEELFDEVKKNVINQGLSVNLDEKSK